MSTFIKGKGSKGRRAAMQAALYVARQNRVAKLTVAHVFDTLDPATLVGGSLSTDNLTFTSDGSNAASGAKTKTNKTTGKWYFEVTIVQINGGSVGGVGAMDKAAAFSTAVSALGTHGACGFFVNGPIFINGSQPGNITLNGGARTPATGDVIGVGIDADAKTITFRNWTSGGTQTAPAAMVSEANYVAAVFVDNNATHLIAKLNFGASAFFGTKFSGYSAWG